MGLQGVAVNGTAIAGHLAPKLRRIPVLLVLRQNDEAGIEAAGRWLEKLPDARLLDYPYGEGEKDLNDQVVMRGLKSTAEDVRDAMIRAGTRPLVGKRRG